MRTLIIILTIFFCSANILKAQVDFISQLEHEKRYTPEEVLAENKEIILYEPLNMHLAWDSVRLCKGYACEGWVTDYYESGLPLHKGYYIEGQLKHYTNFYSDGNKEREFQSLDSERSRMAKYYPDGAMKEETYYFNNEPYKSTIYYPNKKIKHTYELDKTREHLLYDKKYYDNGNPKEIIELANKKKFIYTYKKYHKNGVILEEGKLIYNPQTFELDKTGKWTFRNQNDVTEKEQTYKNGKLVSEKDY